MKKSLLVGSFLFVIVLLYFSCNKKVTKTFLQKVELVPTEYNAIASGSNNKKRNRGCKDKLNHVPNPFRLEYTPLKIVKVNFHIMRDGKGEGNFPNKDQGKMFVKKMLQSANQKLHDNAKMFLPKNNNTQKLPVCVQYELTPRPYDSDDDGIYFHDDEELFFMTNYGKKNIYTRDVYDKYGIQKDTVLNIFVMGVHRDSVTSPTYKMSSNGVAFGRWTKIASNWYKMKNKDWTTMDGIEFRDHWRGQRLLNHEIGHCLGLRHSWRGNDGCDDTPANPNCWNYTKNNSDCDSLVSNNIMDYTAHAGAWTPCQIATIHYNLSKKNYRVRKLLKKTWCTLDESKTITINKGDEIIWAGAKDLEGNIIVKSGAKLTIKCRISIPPNGKIIVEPKGKLILDGAILENDCGETWQGIEVWKTKKEEGQVLMYNDAQITNAENVIDTSGS